MPCFFVQLADVADQVLLLQPLAPNPDRLGIRNAVALLRPREALEAGPVQYLILQRLVGQVVQLLHHQQPDHQLRRIRRTATATAVADLQLGIHRLGQGGEVDGSIQHLQRIAQPFTLGGSFLGGKQADHQATHGRLRVRATLPG